MPERAIAESQSEFFEELGDSAFLYTQINRYIRNKIVLDVACGGGRGTHLISETAKKTFGVDISRKTIQDDKRRFSSDTCIFISADMHRLPFPKNYFDTVVSFETIEHTKRGDMFLSEINRVLKPGGYLLLSTPNNGYDKPIRKKFSKWEFHCNEFTKKDLEELIKKHFIDIQIFGKNKRGVTKSEIMRKARSENGIRLFFLFRILPLLQGIIPRQIKRAYRKKMATSSSIRDYYLSKNEDGIMSCQSFFVVARKPLKWELFKKLLKQGEYPSRDVQKN